EMFGDPVKNEMGWKIKKLGEVCSLIKDGPHISPNYVENGIPFISVHNIVNGFFDFSDIRYICPEDYTYYFQKFRPEFGDILYSKGGTTGIAKRVNIKIDFGYWVHLALLKFPKDVLNPIFFENCLNSPYCKVQAKRYTRGIANRDLVLSQMAKIKIPLPPLVLQQEFARIVEQVEALRERQRQSAGEINLLFEGLMQKAFTGELVA
ncbi:MAG: restriction endonuclease subunit S, partial [Nitrosopumilales archaeon]